MINIQNIILVVLVLVLIYILLKYKEKFAGELAGELAGEPEPTDKSDIVIDSARYKVDPFSKDLTQIDRHSLWANYTLEHDIEKPTEDSKGKGYYDMAYDDISDMATYNYLKAIGNLSANIITFIPVGSVYRHADLTENSIISIGSIVLKFKEKIELVYKKNDLPTIKYNSDDSPDPNDLVFDSYKIEVDENDENDDTKQIIVFNKNKLIDVNEIINSEVYQNVDSVANFSIIIDISKLIPTAGQYTLESAHMNYVLIKPNLTTYNKYDILNELIKINYNILNYKTQILVNYLRCRRNGEDWGTDKVCNLMDKGFTPMDLDSRLYGALKAPIENKLELDSGATSDSMEKYGEIIIKIMDHLKNADADDTNLSNADLNAIFGDDHGFDIDTVKAALGLP
jgi:hypothetical protein